MPRKLLSAFSALAMLFVVACAPKEDLAETPVPIGDFNFGHNIVRADAAQLGPLSREATPEEWETSLKGALEARLGRYTGDKYYHLGINIDAYALAIPGIPVLAKPKSILVASVTVWDDAKGTKINAEPKQFYVFESFSGETFIGSGLTQSKAVQMQNLSTNMSRKIEEWLRENEAWFGGEAARNAPGERSALELPDDPTDLTDGNATAPSAIIPQAGPVVDPVTVVPLN